MEFVMKRVNLGMIIMLEKMGGVIIMTKRNNRGSKNQSSPKRGGKLDTEFGQEVASGDNIELLTA